MALIFFSFDYLLKKTKRTFSRFPFAIILSFLAVIAGILIVEDIQFHGLLIQLSKETTKTLFNFVLTAVFGVPLFVSAKLFVESQHWERINEYIFQFAVIPILILFYIFLPENLRSHIILQRYITQVFLFIISPYILVLLAPFLRKIKETHAWWHYLYIFITRLARTILFTGVFYLGVVFVLFSIKYLFKIAMLSEERIFIQPWIFITGVIALTFFLAGLPENITDLKKHDYKPKYIQYILLPLIAIYAVILYIYGLKILITWDLPEGVVASLILTFITACIFTFLLMYPLWHKNKKYLKWGFIAFLPILLLFFIAIGVRLYDYGFTENRYFVLVFGLWFLIILLYFLFSKKKNILLIPITLFLLIVFSSFGPWGAFDVSEKSQVKRLEQMLIINNILKEGKIVEPYKQKIISDKDRSEIFSILYYLANMHGLQRIQGWFPPEAQHILLERHRWRWNIVGNLQKIIGIQEPYEY